MFLHVVQDLNHGQYRYVTADSFDTDDDARFIEHWDIIDELRDTTVGGRSQVDGPTEPTDPDQTEANKRLVTRYVQQAWSPGTTTAWPPSWLQTSPSMIPTSRTASQCCRPSRPRRGCAASSCIELHRVVGCGDFVATLAETELHGTRHAVIDLYRVHDARIVEHWDVVEEITPKDTWVNVGKF